MFFVLGASVVGCGSEFDTLSGKLENLFNRIETIPNTANKCGNKMRPYSTTNSSLNVRI